ncbi:MAG: hypothetical protein AAF799_18180 [Myxococcota bacterium]
MSEQKPSTIEFVEPCVVELELFGDIDQAELALLIDEFEPKVWKQPFMGLQLGMQQTTSVTPEARRLGAERFSMLPNMFVAVVTESFSQRMIAKLVMTALQLLKPGHVIAEFFSDPEGARAWLREQVTTHETFPVE